jgi:hypothetical protein
MEVFHPYPVAGARFKGPKEGTCMAHDMSRNTKPRRLGWYFVATSADTRDTYDIGMVCDPTLRRLTFSVLGCAVLNAER